MIVDFRHYPLSKPLVINDREFVEVIISSHYEIDHSVYMSDEKILSIVKQLDKRNDFTPHHQGKLPNGAEWQSFFCEPIFYENKALCLVWYWQSNKNYLWILNCFRKKKYEKK